MKSKSTKPPESMKKLYLIDTFSFFFRAYYAIPPMFGPNDLPTNALYGLVSMTIKLFRDLEPKYIAFCYDVEGPSFREKIYADYKANRTEPPEDFKPQFKYVRPITEALGAKSFDKKGFEADDIIGSFVRRFENEDIEIIIVSGDKDLAQLIGKKVSMFDSMKNKLYDVEAAIEKWGVKPEQMVDYLSIVGDASDNIPGVKGVGPKGAEKLLGDYENLEGIYKNIDSISRENLKKKMEEQKDKAFLSRELASLDMDIDLNVQIEDLIRKPIDKKSISELFEILGFESFQKKLIATNDDTPHVGADQKKTDDSNNLNSSNKTQKTREKLLTQEVTLKQLEKLLPPYSEIWIDLARNYKEIQKTSKKKRQKQQISFTENKETIFISHKKEYYAIEIDHSDLSQLGQALDKKNLKYKGYDLKSVWRFLKIKNPLTPLWDQMLAAYIVKPKSIESFQSIYKDYINKDFPEEPKCHELIAMHRDLEKILKNKLEKQQGTPVLNELELPLVPVLYDMENHGISLDLKSLRVQSKNLEKDIKALSLLIYKESGEEFNIASPKQLSHVLFEKMKIPSAKKIKTGFSTSSTVLEKLKTTHPICDYVLQHREFSKLKSTYVDSLPELVNKKTERVHTEFKQAATATGRLSSIHPNLQNIPIRTERGRLIRKSFVAEKGYKFISADYSQIELRVLAHITEDKSLNKAFMEDQDIHRSTASEIFSKPPEEVTDGERRVAKSVNFGIAYGQGVYGLAESLNISRSESREIIEKYFKKFKNIREYMNRTIEDGKSKGYVESIFGRRRYLDEFKSKIPMVRKFAERAAINAPMQCSASDIVKKAMINCYENVSAKMILQVHDELVFECLNEEVEEQSYLIKEIMESVILLSVPLKISLSVGSTWDEAH